MKISEPVFFYSSMRTGGTALIQAFKSLNVGSIFYDPLNLTLSNQESASSMTSAQWASNHPEEFKYFEEYMPLFQNGRPLFYPDMADFIFSGSSDDFRRDLYEYLRYLIDFSHKNGKVPIFKFEQLEGHIDFLREKFPEAIHVGLIRSQDDQLESWLEQSALGISWFFDAARSYIEKDPEFFGCLDDVKNLNNHDVFDIYYKGILKTRNDLDLTIDLYDDSEEEILRRIKTVPGFSESQVALFASALAEFANVDPRPSFEKKFSRMLERSLLLTVQRDDLMVQRDDLTQQRDELKVRLDQLSNSTIWRLTRHLRWIIGLFKNKK